MQMWQWDDAGSKRHSFCESRKSDKNLMLCQVLKGALSALVEIGCYAEGFGQPVTTPTEKEKMLLTRDCHGIIL